MKKDKNLKYKIIGLLSVLAIVGGSIYTNLNTNTENNNDLIDTEPMEVAEEVEVDTSEYEKDLELLEFTINNNLDPHVRNSVVDGIDEEDIVIIGVNGNVVPNVDESKTEPQFAPKEVEVIENKNDVVKVENTKDVVEQPKDEVKKTTAPKEDNNNVVVEKPKPTDPPKLTGDPFVDNPLLRPINEKPDEIKEIPLDGSGKYGIPGKGDKF